MTTRRIASPFLTLSDAAVHASPWEVRLGDGDWTEAGDYLPHWDASCDVRLRRSLRVVPETASADLQVPWEALKLAAAVRIGTGQGRLPRRIVVRSRQPLREDAPAWQLEQVLPGRLLSLVLDLRTEVALLAPPAAISPLAPQHCGDRLWEDHARILLEGEEPRFPIETADLRSLIGNGVASGAPWYLHWSPADWDRDFHGAVRLYLNSEDVKFREKIEAGDPLTMQALLADVMSQISERLLMDPDLVGIFDSAEPGSLGAHAVAWLQKAWPGKDAAFMRSLLDQSPGIVRSTFLALAELRED